MAHKFKKAVQVGDTQQYQLLLECGECGEQFKSHPVLGKNIPEMFRRRTACWCNKPGCGACHAIQEE